MLAHLDEHALPFSEGRVKTTDAELTRRDVTRGLRVRSGLEEEDDDLTVRRAPLVLLKARVHAQALRPDPSPPVPVGHHRPDAAMGSLDDDLGLRMGPQIVIPAGVPALTEVLGNDRETIGGRNAEHGNRPRLAAARSGGGQHHHREAGHQARERVTPARKTVDGAVDVVHRPREQPGAGAAGGKAAQESLRGVVPGTVLPSGGIGCSASRRAMWTTLCAIQPAVLNQPGRPA